MLQKSMHSYFFLALFILALESISATIGISTAPGDSPWYAALEKASLNPPSWVFGVVWPSLYILIGLATWLAWNNRDPQKDKSIFYLFGVHMMMNWSWNFVFFEFQAIGAAFALLLLIIGTLLIIAFHFYKIRKAAGILLIPYVLWTLFAGYLSGSIWFLNT